MNDKLNLPLESDIKKVLRFDGNKLPSFPQAAAKLLKASKDKTASLADLSKIVETDPPQPVEIYGKSKWEGEKILLSYKDAINVTIIRCPTITDAGRLGLLAILFEFIEENRKVYLVGGGDNVYQFIYAPDLADACLKACEKTNTSEVFNIGSDNVKSLKEVYRYVIEKAGSSSTAGWKFPQFT